MTWMIILPLAVLALGLPLAHRAVRPRAPQPVRRERIVLDHRIGFGSAERGSYR